MTGSALEHWKKNIVLFLGSQTISLLGSALVQYAIMWHITLTTQSGVMMTFFILCGFVPTFLLSPFAGIWADRYNRKLLIVAADAMIALTTLLLAVLFMLGYHALWLLFLLSAVRAVGTGIQTPAVGAVLPQIVPEDKLMKVNGVNGSLQALIMLAGPMASAALLSVVSLEIIFLIDVFTAAIAIAILFVFLRIPVHAKAAEKPSAGYWTDLRQGVAYIQNHPFLGRFFLFCAVFTVLSAPVAFLTPLQVTRSFGPDIWRLTAIEVTFSIGMMLGGAIIAAWGGFQNKIYTITLACVVIGACTLALGVVPVFWLYLIVMGLIGVCMPFFNTPSTVLLQEKVEGDYLGRVFGVMSAIGSSMMPLGMLVFGPVADVVRIEWLLIGTGIWMFIQGFFLVGSRALVEAGKPVSQKVSRETG